MRMRQTYLVQRLEKPRNSLAWSFGCVPNGCFSKEAAEVVSKIYSFDYMGSSEFEWGAVPKAFQTIANYSGEDRARTGVIDDLPADVFYICEDGTEEEVIKRILKLYEDERSMLLIEPSYFRLGVNSNAKRPVHSESLTESMSDDSYRKYIGWLELDNGFLFVIDEKMYQDSLSLFDLKKSKA